MTTSSSVYGEAAAALAEGARCLREGHLISAKAAFGKAHGLGHDSTRLHVRAHLGLVRVALAERKLGDLLGQLSLAAFAQLFTRPLLSSEHVAAGCADRA